MPNIKASTQQHLEIADIRDNLVILKNGSVSLTLQTTAVNFGLLSENEQDVIIYAYAALLNSLNFPIQIVIRSKRSDVSAYLDLLSVHEAKQINPDLKKQIKEYRDFVAATVQKNQVLAKSFYLIITQSALELGVKGAAATLSKKQKGLPYPKEYLLEQAKTNLYPKRDHLIKQLTRLGLKAKELTTQELVELYYDIYNPAEVASQKVSAEEASYTAPLVAPAIEELQTQKATPTQPTPLAAEQPKPPTPSPAPPSAQKSSQMEQKIQSTPPASADAAESDKLIQPKTEKTIGTKTAPAQTPKNLPSQQQALESLKETMVKANQLVQQQKRQSSQPKTQPEQKTQP